MGEDLIEWGAEGSEGTRSGGVGVSGQQPHIPLLEFNLGEAKDPL